MKILAVIISLFMWFDLSSQSQQVVYRIDSVQYYMMDKWLLSDPCGKKILWNYNDVMGDLLLIEDDGTNEYYHKITEVTTDEIICKGCEPRAFQMVTSEDASGGRLSVQVFTDYIYLRYSEPDFCAKYHISEQ